MLFSRLFAFFWTLKKINRFESHVVRQRERKTKKIRKDKMKYYECQ